MISQLYSFDAGSKINVISKEMVNILGISPSQDGKIRARGPFKGEPLAQLLRIDSKLKINIQDYKDEIEFMVGPIDASDVFLRYPWHYEYKLVLD